MRAIVRHALLPTIAALIITLSAMGFERAPFTIVELNCENLFDTIHDDGKDDHEFLPTSKRQWTRQRYWRKLNNIGRTILSSTSGDHLPDLVALVEVENDTVMHDLTHRSLLREAGYEYILTNSDDERGIDVALLYQPYSFRIIDTLTISFPATRSVLFVRGERLQGDTLDIFILHMPSRRGDNASRKQLRQDIAQAIITHSPTDENIIVLGDFNDYADGRVIRSFLDAGFIHASKDAPPRGDERATGTYKFRGHWGSLDHILMRGNICQHLSSCFINASSFLLMEDRNGEVTPRRTYRGTFYQEGYSDHLPLVLQLTTNQEP